MRLYCATPPLRVTSPHTLARSETVVLALLTVWFNRGRGPAWKFKPLNCRDRVHANPCLYPPGYVPELPEKRSEAPLLDRSAK